MRKFCVITFLLPALAFGERAYDTAAIAAAHPLASAAGQQMLEKGGTATDAAVAAAFVMAVVAPSSSGLGGGGFAVSWDAAKKEARAFDFREVAPAKATREMFLRDGQAVPELSTDGALSVAVPGAVKGYLALHAQHGKLPLKVVLAPAIAATKKGLTVDKRYLSAATERLACLKKDAEATRIFLRDGAVPPFGTPIPQPDLGRTLEAIAKSGDKAFYEGPIAAAIADTVTRAGGVLTAADLKAYRTRDSKPLWGSYRGHRVATMPPPSAGGVVVLQVLGVMERASPLGLASRDVGVLHHYIEALRRSYVDRAKDLSDPERLVSAAYLDAMKASIDPKKATKSAALMPRAEQKHTTHVSVVDKAGNAVGLTTTVNYLFGSCLVARGTGVVLNDEMDDFAAQPGTPNVYGLVTGETNAVAPGKVPQSSMAPTLVFQKDAPDEVLLVVGSPGGSTIPTTVIQVVSNVVDAKMDAARAVGFGRIHHQWLPDRVDVDAFGLEPETRKKLEALGHTLYDVEAWGDPQAVKVDPVTKRRSAGSDPRNQGVGAGVD